MLNVIDIAYSRNWLNLWIECDSPSVASSLVNRDYHPPWSLRNSWLNCLDKITRMRVQVTHIFREGVAAAHQMQTWVSIILLLNGGICLLLTSSPF